MTGSTGGSSTGKRGLLGDLLGGGLSKFHRRTSATLTSMQVHPELVPGIMPKALRPRVRQLKVVSRRLQALALKAACLHVPTTEPSL